MTVAAVTAGTSSPHVPRALERDASGCARCEACGRRIRARRAGATAPRPALTRTRSVPGQPDASVMVVTTLVSSACTSGRADRVSVNGRVIGFVYSAGRVSVALAGPRVDQAVECAQALCWGAAVAQLVAATSPASTPLASAA